MFEKIVEMAIHSGLDKIGVDEDEGEKEEGCSLHCENKSLECESGGSKLPTHYFPPNPL